MTVPAVLTGAALALAAVAAQRGVQFDLTMFFNDRSAFLDDPSDMDPAAACAQFPEAEARKLVRDTVIAPAGTMHAHGPPTGTSQW